MFDFSTIWQKLHEMANGLLALLPNLALALIVLAIFYYGGKWAKAAVAGIAHRYSEAPGVGLVIGRLTQLVVVIIGAMIALSIVLPSFRASDLIQLLGISGVAIGFAFRDIFQNFLAGILLVLTHPFRIGDQIRVKDFEGTVEDIQTRATLIRTADGRRIVIPNADLFTESVTVNTAFGIRRSEYELALSHTEDVEQVRGALRETVSSVDGVLRDPQPDVLVTGFAAHSVKVRIRWWTAARRSNIAEIQDRVIMAVRQKLNHLKEAASEAAPQSQDMLSQKAG